MESLRALKRSIVVCACVALPLVLAGASLAGKTPAKKAPHRPPVRHTPKHVAGIAAKPKFQSTTILVKFLKPSAAARAVRAAHDLPVRSVNGVEVVRLQRGETVAAKVRQYDRRRDVAYAMPNYLVHAAALGTPNDALYLSQQLGLQRIQALAGWSLFPGSYLPLMPTPTIAIVDSGVDFSHQDLAGQAASQNATCSNAACVATGSPSDVSSDRHGTEVAGIAGALTNNTVGIAGVAFSSPLMSVQVLDSGDGTTFANAAAGINWAADHGARIINVSFGGTGSGSLLCAAVAHATSLHAIVVAAAGNSSDFNKPGSATAFFPAACPGAIGVAATDNSDGSPQFSNFGFPDVFLSAPGVNEISTNPLASGGYTTTSLIGTSFAAPFVSGAAALVLGQYTDPVTHLPIRTDTDVKRVLARTAAKAGSPVFPYGADPFHTCTVCTWDQFYGYGRVDLLGALTGPTPVITGVSPQSGPVGTAVTVSGLDFTAASSVHFGLKDAGAPSVANSGQLTTSVPAGANNGRITVTTPGGTSLPSPTSFQIVPDLSAFSGKAGDVVEISGPKLDDNPAVSFGGVAASSVSVVDATHIDATVPAGAGTGRLTVTTDSSGQTPYTSAQPFVVTPTITHVTPSIGVTGDAVMIVGTGFSGITSVKFGGVPATFTPASPTVIRTHIPPTAITGDVTVTTGTTSATKTGAITVRPTVASFLPTRGAIGSGVTVTGTGFRSNGGTPPTVEFNGAAVPSASVTAVTPTSLHVVVPAGATSGPIKVTTADGFDSSVASFVLQPKITSISPAPSTGAVIGATVTITGTSFTGATAVSFNGTPASSFTVDSDTQITTSVPDDATTGLVTVVTPADTAVFATPFKVQPTITGIDPTSGPTGSLVTITGHSFNGATSVTFNGIAAGFNVIPSGVPSHPQATQIQATVPNTATNGAIVVTTPGGTATSSSFSLTPKILSFTPTSGATGTQVTINGTGFGATVTDVRFGGLSADPASINRVSAQQMTATVPAGATTGQITVVTSGGQDTSLGSFSVVESVTGLSPLSGPEGARIELDGLGFSTTSTVTFGGGFTVTGCTQTLAQPCTVNATGTELDVNVPVGALSGPISVTTGAVGHRITATSAQSFTVAPTITGFSPLAGAVGASLTVNGRNLQGATEIDFGGIAATPTSVATDGTSATVTVPSGALSGPLTLLTPLAMTQSTGTFYVLPTLSGMSPDHGPVGSIVHLTGTSLDFVDSVDFNGTNAPSFAPGADSSHLDVTVPSGATTGAIHVKDGAPSPHTATLAGPFTVTAGITGFAPASGTAGDHVTITGTDFATINSVTFNGVSAGFTRDSSTQITATVPAGATSGPIVVNATNDGVTTSPASALNFLVPASIASLSPMSGSAGDAVTIHGTGFTNVQSVAFNGVPVTDSMSTAVSSDGATIDVHVPAAATTGKITVTTDAGTATSGDDFTVVPVVESISPGTALAGETITVTGRSLGALNAVDIGTGAGAVPAAFGMLSPTTLTVTVPDAAVSGPVVVHSLNGPPAVSTDVLTVAPSLLGFSPVSAATGATITLTGSGLAGVVGVSFTGAAAPVAPSSAAANSLTVLVPSDATTGPVTVTDGAGNHSTSNDSFAVLGP